MSNVSVGNKGEDLACDYLEKLGYKILDRNYRIRGGEIDIIATDKNILVFIEVKTRYSRDFGLPSEAITPWKIRLLLKTAQFYLQKINWKDDPYRLDAVLIDFSDSKEHPQLELVKSITS
jgi:putative endonuclease